jgi:tagaturonate reductase
MILSRKTLENIHAENISKPGAGIFELPEKVLQFGTGVLLRGLIDYFIDKANRQGIFNGRVVVVKSTDGGDAGVFAEQDALYTLSVRGLENGEKKEEDLICSPISRVIQARSEWGQVLQCAHNPQLKIVVSNTTEVGIQLVHEKLGEAAPESFPGKLLALLYERYKTFRGAPDAGMIIIPTELIVDNGKKLKAIVAELAAFNELEPAFMQWLDEANIFCSSLVDRIVPGKPSGALQADIEKKLGLSDGLMIMAEVYRLWAIEGDKKVRDVLTFAQADEGVVIEEDINLYRELKLRMLNGTHTFSCGLAFLCGFRTVKEGMADKDLGNYVSSLMLKEIGPSIPYEIDEASWQQFGNKVLDRFRNPFIEHQWISITVQYTSKMRMRNVPLLLRFYELRKQVPELMVTGFAAYLLFMRVVRKDAEKYYGNHEGSDYPVQDDRASYFFEKWKNGYHEKLVRSVLADADLWGTDLASIPGFADAVDEKMRMMMKDGVLNSLKAIEQKQIPV